MLPRYAAMSDLITEFSQSAVDEHTHIKGGTHLRMYPAAVSYSWNTYIKGQISKDQNSRTYICTEHNAEGNREHVGNNYEEHWVSLLVCMP